MSEWAGPATSEYPSPLTGGGAVISLTAVFEDLVDCARIIELDPDVAAVWETILYGDAEWLANEIIAFQVTHESVQDALLIPPQSTRGRAFATILKARADEHLQLSCATALAGAEYSRQVLAS